MTASTPRAKTALERVMILVRRFTAQLRLPGFHAGLRISSIVTTLRP
jgi:hypothetical protein